MAMHWSGWEGGTYTGFRVGIDVTVSPSNPSHSDTSVKVIVKWYVGSNGSVNDDMTFHKGGDASGSIDFHYSAGNSTSSKLLATSDPTYGISYGNSGSKTFTASLSGVYNGATPSISVTVNLPERPAAAPDKPSKPNIVIDGSSSLHVNWSKPDGNGDSVDYMQYQLDNSSSFSSPVDDHNDGASPSGTSGLSKYTTYYARVRAHNGKGFGDWSATDSARTDGTVPSKIRSLAVTNVVSTGVHFTWSPPSDDGGPSISDYAWSVCTDSAGNNIVLSGNGTSRSISANPGLSPSHTYYIRVRARNSVGSSDVVIKSFKTQPPTGPGYTEPTAPGTPTTGTLTKSTAAFTWTVPSSDGGDTITNYSFQVANNLSFDDDSLLFDDDTPDATRAITVTGLPLNTLLFARVQANNGAGSGSWSGVRSFTTLSGFKRWDGAAWVNCTTAKRWNGTAWVNITKVKHSTGTGTGNWAD